MGHETDEVLHLDWPMVGIVAGLGVCATLALLALALWCAARPAVYEGVPVWEVRTNTGVTLLRLSRRAAHQA